ncbi:MAG: LPO_1073/Vpar_1526 family protein [Bacteroidales bacterium]|nr:LPO_1073/Vpar_1526 family protein [Bacteroidales bacterium]
MEIQKAGDNSHQYQIQNLTIQQGIDEKRAREIYDEKYSIAKQDFTEEALRIANERVKELEDRLIPKMEAVKDGLKVFADPSFQLLLVDAQKAAAATERPVDYDLLSELLVHRIEMGNDRHIRTGIHRAVEIVEDVSNEALLGLTVVHSLNSFLPVSSECASALDILDGLYGSIIYDKLPEGNEWIEDLDILDAIRVNHFGKFKSIKEYYASALNGIVTIGIKKDSDDYNKAIKILQDNRLMMPDLFIGNSLIQDYMRINIRNFKEIESMMLVSVIDGTSMPPIPFSEQQKTAIKSIVELYVKDSKLKNDVEESFISEWDKRSNLASLRKWLEKIPHSFSITSVGKVLAHANAQRCDSKLPPLNNG